MVASQGSSEGSPASAVHQEPSRLAANVPALPLDIPRSVSLRVHPPSELHLAQLKVMASLGPATHPRSHSLRWVACPVSSPVPMVSRGARLGSLDLASNLTGNSSSRALASSRASGSSQDSGSSNPMVVSSRGTGSSQGLGSSPSRVMASSQGLVSSPRAMGCLLGQPRGWVACVLMALLKGACPLSRSRPNCNRSFR